MKFGTLVVGLLLLTVSFLSVSADNEEVPAHELINDRSFSKIVTVFIDTEYARGIAEDLRFGLEFEGYNVVSWELRPDQQDLDIIASDIYAESPDIIVFVTGTPIGGDLYSFIRAEDEDLPFISIDTQLDFAEGASGVPLNDLILIAEIPDSDEIWVYEYQMGELTQVAVWDGRFEYTDTSFERRWKGLPDEPSTEQSTSSEEMSSSSKEKTSDMFTLVTTPESNSTDAPITLELPRIGLSPFFILGFVPIVTLYRRNNT